MSLQDVMRWCAKDESNSAEINLSSDGPSYGEDEELPLGIVCFEVNLSGHGLDPEVVREWPYDNPTTFLTHRGFGSTIDEACSEALRMMNDWNKWVANREVTP